jgi:mannose-6-phosphate isomerase
VPPTNDEHERFRAKLARAVFALDCVVKPYAWGSRSAIAMLCRRPAPSPEPEAELWMGAHPLGSSRVRLPSGDRSLADWASSEPARVLGAAHQQRFGRLSFLLKVLAAEEPLSLQVHPSLEQARAGFAREEAAKVPLEAANRNYKDDNHKPELLVALGPFEALSGFRSNQEIRGLFARLSIPELDALSSANSSLPSLFAAILSLSADARRRIAAPFIEATRREAAASGNDARAFEWAERLARKYPEDPGAIASLMLRHVSLRAGEGIYLGAGNLHAYLSGLGIEIMASSDNVLRGGLTPKYVDVAELLRVIDFEAQEPALVRTNDDGDFDTPAPEFQLSRFDLPSEAPFEVETHGPEIVLVTRGQLTVRSAEGEVTLRSGESAFAPGSLTSYVVSGAGELYRARAKP